MSQIASHIINKLGLHAISTISDDQFMEKLIDYLEIKFHLNENID